MHIPTTVPMDHPTTSSLSNSHAVTSATRPVGSKRFRLKVIGLTLVSLLVAGGAAYVTLDKSQAAEKVRSRLESLKEKVVGATVARPPADASSVPSPPPEPWNGLVKVDAAKRKAIGFRILPVQARTEPIKLELPGRTDYDQNTLNKIRSRFDKTVVEKVYVSIGQTVKKGDPLYDFRSVDLADAKKDCRVKFVQYDHDRKLKDTREPLAKVGQITQLMWTETQIDEKKSRLDYLNARDLLGNYEIPNDQIDKLLEGLGDDKKKALEADDNTQDSSRMTIMSKYDGVVVERDVVPGNLYDNNDVLLTISPMEKLWVWGDVFESDQDKVHLGQKWTVVIKSTNEEIEGRVESISQGIDPETRTLKVRGSVPNPGKNHVARALVRAIIQSPPLPTDTAIPRNAMVVIDGDYYSFVQVGPTGKEADLFERRKIDIEQEDHDIVIVKHGLKPGDLVVSNGSLILAQMYEDRSTIDSGMPRP